MPLSLCQPGEGASCGACCGLYNFKVHTRSAVTKELRRHTDLLSRTPRTKEAYAAAAEHLKEHQPPPAFSDVRVCPLLGFLDGGQEQRVGCLAHPKHTGGVDLRDCGVYRAEICEGFECPSHLWLTADEARLIHEACRGDWYLYGLVITDVDFFRAAMKLLARLMGEDVPAARLLADGRPATWTALRRVLALRETPASDAERSEGAIFGRFVPPSHPGGEPGLRTLDYEGLGARSAPEDELVLLTGRSPRTPQALARDRAEIHDAIRSLAEALAAK